MSVTAFIFGRTPDLSFEELRSQFPSAKRILPDIAIVSDPVSSSRMVRLLGGTVKIVRIEHEQFKPDAIHAAGILAKHAPEGQLTFGISVYGQLELPASFAAAVKRELVATGMSVRYVEPKHESHLSSVVVAGQKLTELVCIAISPTQVYAGFTEAVQDFEDWNTRDYGRPAADPKRGMLPPKVARMIVNIARGYLSGQADKDSARYTPTILDPFCGTGTILAEALCTGSNVIGCDVSEGAADMAKANLDWLRTRYPETETYFVKIAVSDATHISKIAGNNSIDAIVTEPFMGENADSMGSADRDPAEIKPVLKGLEKLYIGALRDWTTVVKAGGVVVMAMPKYVLRRGTMRVKNVVDRCESLGYTLLNGPVEYSRPHAVVHREFYIFRKK